MILDREGYSEPVPGRMSSYTRREKKRKGQKKLIDIFFFFGVRKLIELSGR